MAEPDIIQLLPDSVANQIAAGEVIQQPSSVIKELVENSVDAGARNIEIIVKDAGKTLIQVVDDGKGMSTTDARMAFERHATSKIKCADDLFSLHTMGFRGEALPSIAAVSELELNTRRESDELGTRLIIRASHVDSQEPTLTAKGTNIKVKNLFYNFVARRRFLKKDSVELNQILHEFERLALVNTDIAFKFTSNGVLLHSLPRGLLKDRISALFGKSISENLIPVNVETSLVSINGFISLPAGARQRNQRQFLFVNGRNMRHLYFRKAILSCYENLIPKDYQPHYFINFKVAADRIDVNIHPQKHEIKFEDEQSIWQILTASVREALGRYHASTALDFNNLGAPEIPAVGTSDTPVSLSSLTGDNAPDDYNPFFMKSDNNDTQFQSRLDFGSTGNTASANSRPSSINSPTKVRGNEHQRSKLNTGIEGWEDFYKSLERQNSNSENTNSFESDIRSTTNGTEKSTLILDDGNHFQRKTFQVRNSYIITEGRDGLLFIDQHRAHVNILYYALTSELDKGNISSQSLMFSVPLELDSDQKVLLDSVIDTIEKIGFVIGTDSHGQKVIESIPGTLGDTDPAKIVINILDGLTENGSNIETEIMNRAILATARGSAIKRGTQLNDTEIEHLISSLFKLPTPDYTPDGKKIIYRLTDQNLKAFFN